GEPTPNLLNAIEALTQLSYAPTRDAALGQSRPNLNRNLTSRARRDQTKACRSSRLERYVSSSSSRSPMMSVTSSSPSSCSSMKGASSMLSSSSSTSSSSAPSAGSPSAAFLPRVPP